MHIVFVDSNMAGLDAIKCAKEAGHRVTYIQPPDSLFYSLSPENLALIGYADQVEDVVATTEAAPVTAALARIHAAHPVDFAVSFFDLSLEPVALACQALGLPGTSPEGILTARHKDRMRAALQRKGVATARFSLARDGSDAAAAADVIGYPVVVKPPSGLDSRLAFAARDSAELRAGCQRAEADLREMPSVWQSQLSRGFLVEEHLSGPLVSVEIGMSGERSYLFGISGRARARENEVVETGVHIPAELPDGQARACTAYAESVCRAIGLDRGVFHVEMIITARGPVVVEANPRVMGGMLPAIYQHATGRNIYRAFVQVISGTPVDGVPPSFTGCVAGRRFFAREAATMPASWNTDDWLGDSREDLISLDTPEALGLRPGKPLRRGDLIARVILRGPDYAATTYAVGNMLRRTEKALGVELMNGEYDSRA